MIVNIRKDTSTMTFNELKALAILVLLKMTRDSIVEFIEKNSKEITL